MKKAKELETVKAPKPILCALFGTKVCPLPHDCDGINRNPDCDVWWRHSSK